MSGLVWTSTFQAIWQVSSLCILGVSTRLSQKKFPRSYSCFSHTISVQGNPDVNSKGHIYWRIGALLVGLLRIVDFAYVYLKMQPVSKIGSLAGFIFGLIATFGFSMVGIISEKRYKPHIFFAKQAFVGYFLSANIYLVLLLGSSVILRLSASQIIAFILCYLCFELSFLAMIVSFFKNGGDKLQFNKHRWRGFPIWEWIYFLNIIFWTIVISVIVRRY
jgi:hypothetical protein